ncbi:unnamed protein product [Acanthosepion pharaonis]|uniref:Uncharacterized protein n=1 Tax=Acanthosepion pharaonis TaxID=158019 RepID=A0A812BD93_ACAPH|nr:unnamed protein product [Sepia pharaonis]
MFYKNLQHWFGSFQAFGGTGKPNPGGAGTIYLKDDIPHIKNTTLIIDNNNQALTNNLLMNYSTASSHSWLLSNDTPYWDIIHVTRQAHFAIHPNLTRPFHLKAYKFVSDKTGVLHIGNNQVVIVQHPDDLEFFLNINVYEGGTLILPKYFSCYGVQINIWGRIGLKNIYVGQKCSLKFGLNGTSLSANKNGVYSLETLTIGAEGEVTVTDELKNDQSRLNLEVSNFLL